MSDDVVIRPLTPEDVPGADRVGWASLQSSVPADMMPDETVRVGRGRARVAHLQRTDPGGCWVAEAGGEVIGVALSLIRDGVWGFSLFGIDPDHQGKGIGTRLFAPALAYGDGTRGGIILSSTHPAAMRRYARAGFALHPCVAASGIADRRFLPSGLRSRPADLGAQADRATMTAASLHVRGATHDRDLEALVDTGSQLLVLDGRGFAGHRDGSVTILAATDEEAARDLLWSCLAAQPSGATVGLDFMSAQNGWAVDVALETRLALTPDGPVFVRGQVGPMAPFLPSGAYL